MEVVVFGAGSLGSLIGGLLAREHDVTLVGRRPHVDVVAETGLRVTGAVETAVTPAATDDGRELSADLVVVTVKAHDTADAAAALATGSYRAAVSLQNGLGNEETLAGALDCPVLAGVTTYGAKLVEPGIVRCTGVGQVAVGERDGGVSDLARDVAEAFVAAGVRASPEPEMPRQLWSKLAVNAGINGVTALARVQNGAVLSGDAWDVAREATREAARVARARGIELPPARAVAELGSVAESTAGNASSTLQDVRDGRRTEVDALNGAVVDAGDHHDVATPVNRTLAGLLRTWERGAGLRGADES